MAIKFEREYYTIQETAKLLSCSADDLIHFAANSRLHICVLLVDTNINVECQWLEQNSFSDHNEELHSEWIVVDEESNSIYYTGLAALDNKTVMEFESGKSEVTLKKVAAIKNKPSFIDKWSIKYFQDFVTSICYYLDESICVTKNQLFITKKSINRVNYDDKNKEFSYDEITFDELANMIDKQDSDNRGLHGLSDEEIFDVAYGPSVSNGSVRVSSEEKPLNTRAENNYLRLIMQLAISNIKDFDPKKPYEAAALIKTNIDTELSEKTIAGYITKAHELESKERN